MIYLHFFQLEGDKLFQAIGAKNLIEGNGITFQHVLASDLSTQVSEPVNRWPVGYTLLLAPLYWITHHLQAACALLDFLSISFFFFAVYRLLRHLQMPPLVMSAVILFCGSTFGPSVSKPTDLIACACVLYACVLYIVFIAERSRSPYFGLAIGAAITIAAALRYMYAPCLLILPALLFWTGYQKNDKRIRSGAKYTMATSMILYIAFVQFQSAVVGSSVYIIGAEKGFFPLNLLSLYPFIPDAFVDINFTLQQVASISHVSFVFLFTCLRYINLLLLGILLYKCISFVKRNAATTWKTADSFFVLSGLISCSILLLLSYLSITNSPAPIPLHIPFPWTFIGDGRYFLFPATILPISAAWWLFNKQPVNPSRIRQPLKYLFFALIIFQVIHTAYFLVRRFDAFGLKGENVLITGTGDAYLRSRVNECKKNGFNVVITGTDEFVANWATLHGAKGILHVSELLTANVRAPQPSIVFVLVPRNMLPFIRQQLTDLHFGIEKEIDRMIVFSKKY